MKIELSNFFGKQNNYLYRESKNSTYMDTHQKDLLVVGIGILLVVAAALVFYPINTSSNQVKQEITSFEECIAAGNPAMESHPRKCRDPVSDKTFIEDICPEEYSLDVDVGGCTKG
ncbi:MAG: hypothetical protein GTO02_09835, partial [Candidatus Dadabacteria bacterium]|nr:hypothetical protein [Candidatus Dadabacteria bacterium]